MKWGSLMRKLIFLLLVIILSGSLIAQMTNELNIVGNGARTAGMGYASTGLADDATAISVNPAGITQLMSMEASVVGRLSSGSVDMSFRDVPDVTADVDQRSNFDLNFASFIIPLSTRKTIVVGGVAYRRLVDAKSKFDVSMSLFGQKFLEGTQEVTGGIQAITPALAVEITSNLSLGAGGNIMFGTTQSSTEAYGQTLKYPEKEYSGFSFDIGALFKASDQFSIGAMVTPGYTLTTTIDKPDPDEPYKEIKTEMPLTANFGIAFKPSPEFTIVADYRLRPFSKAKRNLTTIDDEEYKQEDFWEDINSFHVGVEYLIMAGDLIIPIRGGFYTNPTVGTSYDPNKVDFKGDQIKGNVITVGVGLAFERLLINAAVELGSIDEYVAAEYFGDPPELYVLNLKQSFVRFSIGAVLHLGK